MRALVIIDIDNHNGWRQRFLEEDESHQIVASAIEKTLCQARSASIPIIFVVFVYGTQCAWKDRVSLAESQRHLPDFLNHRHNAEPIFFKIGCNAFEKPYFTENLRARGIDELLLAGCATYACIEATACGAAREGFEVYILEECIYPRFKDENEKAMWLNRMNDRVGEKNSIFVHIIKTIDA